MVEGEITWWDFKILILLSCPTNLKKKKVPFFFFSCGCKNSENSLKTWLKRTRRENIAKTWLIAEITPGYSKNVLLKNINILVTMSKIQSESQFSHVIFLGDSEELIQIKSVSTKKEWDRSLTSSLPSEGPTHPLSKRLNRYFWGYLYLQKFKQNHPWLGDTQITHHLQLLQYHSWLEGLLNYHRDKSEGKSHSTSATTTTVTATDDSFLAQKALLQTKKMSFWQKWELTPGKKQSLEVAWAWEFMVSLYPLCAESMEYIICIWCFQRLMFLSIFLKISWIFCEK